MHLFLSYGHDEHTAFALRLKADLEQRGLRVWFDAERLKGGVDWERYIDDGLDQVFAYGGKFILLLTPHSVRRPDGYCLNELARACSRGLRVIPVMVATVEPPLSICRVQWLDFRDCVPADQHEVKYAARFEKLLEAIEHDGLDLEGAQARLRAVLQPIEYDEPARHLARFTGREWVNREIEEWLARAGRRALWITGEAGIGKSALAAWLCERRPEIAGAHYCRHGDASRSNRAALLSLAWQLSTQLGDYQVGLNASALEGIAGETSLGGLFDRLFVAPLSHGFPAPGRSVVLLIDALDEASDKRELASLIAAEWDRTPEWLRLIVTSRPHEVEINTALQALDPWLLDAGRKENQADIRKYLGAELRAPEAAVEATLEKSEGLFLYARWVRQEIQEGRLSIDDVGAFPQGLGGIYNLFFQRYFRDTGEYQARWRPVIETICAARQPLPLEELGALFPAFYDPIEIASGLGSLFPESGGGLRPFHQSVRDWVTDRNRAGLYVVRTEGGHRRLATEGWGQYESHRMRPYFVAHLPAHLSACGHRSELEELLLDPEWMVAKLRARDVNALIGDYDLLKLSEEAELLGGALRLSAHVLAGDAGQFASQMTGRLLAGHSDWVSVAVTPDGTRVVSASDDETLKVWDLEKGRPVRMLQGHSAVVSGVAVTPDGKRAVSPSHDRTLRVWELETGRPFATFHCDAEALCCALADDDLIIAGDAGGRVQFVVLEERTHRDKDAVIL